jgi:hypothetical protein
VEWAVNQPEALRAMIRDLHPESAEKEISSQIALSIAAMEKRSKIVFNMFVVLIGI